MTDPAKQAIPEAIADAHKRMEIGFQRLTDDEATRLLECATAEFHRAERFLAQAKQGAKAYDDLLTASQKAAEEADRLRKKHGEIWGGVIKGQNLTIFRLKVDLIAAVVCIAGLLIALWSCHASP